VSTQQRPPTKREVWAEVEATYADTLDAARRVQLARDRWTWRYVRAVNFHGWRKQPDWQPGDPVIVEGVPSGPFTPDRATYPHVQRLWQLAQRGRSSE
jgi:hypothetical protein